MHRLALFALILGAHGVVWSPPAPAASANPLSNDLRIDYQAIRDYVMRAADKMPDVDYPFRPSPDVRSFAQQMAHIADDQYNLCAPALGERRAAAYTAIESSLSRKMELVAALKDAFAYCDRAYDALTDASATEPSLGRPRNRFAMLNWNLWHTWEHYGNIVVYLRMKGIVPPTSEPSKPR